MILVTALVMEAIGVVFLSKGLKEIDAPASITPAGVAETVKSGIVNKKIWLGIFFEALFFAGILILMARAEVSFIWPLTSLGFVLTTLAASVFLHEKVSSLRWTGVVLIMIGAALVSWSQQRKEVIQDSAPPEANSVQLNGTDGY